MSRVCLAMPITFRAEGHALGVIKAHNLFPLGAQVERTEKTWPGGAATWRIVIHVDTDRQPDAVLAYLKSHMPGVHWERSDEP